MRASIERLDDLVKAVSEMVISRSIFEQRLFELEQQIQELKHTNNRLRRSTNKLEVDFEARALGNSDFSLPSFSFNKQTAKNFTNNKLSEFDLLEFDQYTEFHQTTRELIETTGDTSAIHNDLENILSNLGLLFESQRHLIDEMQENLLRLRMVSLSSISMRLQRAIRVTASDEKKLVELNIENENIEIDTQILDAFVEPLIHLLRNAVAHGIEPPETRKLLGKSEKGTVTLKAYSEGTHIVFAISDDGRGISPNSLKEEAVRLRFITPKEAKKMSDEEAFSLIFLPGLSTAEDVNEISGRGVGMNIVKSIISRRNGDIFISSEPQKGTTFTVRLPMSLAVTRVLLVKSNQQTFAFPLKLVKQVVEVSPNELETIIHEKKIVREGKSYKFFHFNELIKVPVSAKTPNNRISLLLLETPDKPCALLVDQIIKPEEVVIKPLGNLLRNVPDIIGATILGDGSIVPVLDLIHLLKRKPNSTEKVKPLPIKAKSEISVLIVDDSPSVRQINSNLVKNAGWQPILARDGLEALEVIQSFQELPDIILTDVEMPKMDGYEFLASLKRQENLRSIPVIMITSRSSEKHRRKAFDLGVSEYLTKPFEEWVLIENIKQLVNI
ncbi:MAG TPA: response regulator [Pyrinomonadaceae bacterium]|nr:response regulator [Pyrinomonadaceae bacterium]